MARKNHTRDPFLLIAGTSGVLFAAIILLVNAVVFVPAGLPSTGADTETVVRFFADGSAMLALGSAFLPLAWLLAAVFAAGAVAANRHREGERGEAWSLVGMAGVISQNVTIAGVSAIRIGLSNAAPASEDVVGALWALHDALFTLNGTFLAMALVGLSLGGLRSGVLRRPFAMLGLIAAALQFASATLTPQVSAEGGALGLLGLAGWLLWVVWLAAYGAALIRRGRTADRRQTDQLLAPNGTRT